MLDNSACALLRHDALTTSHMRTSKIIRVWILLSGALIAAVSVAQSGPAAPLIYTGELFETGKPVTGERTISIAIWDAADSGSALCEFTPPGVTLVQAGQFQLELSEECRSALASTTEAWLALTVEGVALTRVRIGAVPSAIQADVASSAVAALEDRISALENPDPYCGPTPASTGSKGGYKGVKDACETACSSDLAHLCSADELVASREAGSPTAAGWFAGGYAWYPAATGTTDCDGWTVNAGPNARLGNLWNASFPAVGYCSNPYPFLCCK